MHRRRSQVTISVVAVLLGLLVVVQLRGQQAESALSGMSAQNLTVLIANVNAGNEQLRKEIANLDVQLARIKAAQARGETSVEQVRDDLSNVRAWTGLEPVAGQGVTISVAGPISGPAVQDLLNELRNAGAEAIAVADVRLVAGSVVSGAPGDLSIEGERLDDPFEIQAIGSKEVLTGSLTRIGGVVAQLAATFPSAVVTITPVDRLELPATRRSLQPTNGHPAL